MRGKSLNFPYSIKRKVKLKEEFIPIVVISTITIYLFITFILNIAILAIILMIIVGIIICIKSIYEIIKHKEKINFNYNIIFLVIFLVWAAWRLQGTILTAYDNFSHWALIVKEMLITNKLPNFESTTITFTSYPPGTACFIYLFCKFFGNSEARMLFAQAILIISGFYCLFAFCNRKRKATYVVTIISLIYMIIGNIFIDQLLVDTALASLGIAAFAIIIYYRNNPEKGLVFSIPILSMLVIVKNSGIFFTIINIAVWIFIFSKKNGFKNVFKSKYLLLLLIPIMLIIIWNGHTDLVFANNENTKHSMSIQNYSANIEEKNADNIKAILKQMLNKMLNLQNSDNIIILLIFLTLIATLILSYKNKKLKSFIFKMIIVFICSYIIYQIGLFGMYLFSMPIEEALNLASYERYFKTMLLFNYSIGLITILTFLSNFILEGKIKNIILSIILIILVSEPVILYRNTISKMWLKSNSSDSIRNTILEYKSEYDIQEEKSYLIYISDDMRSDYIYYICKYDFRSPNIKIIKSFNGIEKDTVNDFDYLIILDLDYGARKYLKDIEGDIEANVIKPK